MERIRVHATTEHLLAVVGLLMHTLSAGGDLEASHEEVEAQCERGVLGVVHRIESTVLGREMGDEHEVRTVFLEGVLTDSTLLFRRKVILAAVICFAEMVLKEDLVYLAQIPCRYLLRKDRIDGIEEVELVRAVTLYDGDDMTQQGCFEDHDILLTFDEAHLHIEGDILIEVTGGSRFLCAVCGSNLEDALIDADADLFVELGDCAR